ncbi:MAG TPA: molecular chaperone TorD family protein [Burkholderiales bacterium]|jgi:TorA maturation chaperone TorD|nr:molecular chaperone TorD family protein [Burkholderiales bacterium]
MTAPGQAAALDPEDEARAALYGLIAQLFYAPPDQGVLAQILNAGIFEGSDAGLSLRWRELVARCQTAFPVLLENEHTDLFIGTGRAAVTPYLIHYLIERSTDNPLVQLRKQLAEWGISRRERATEPEDHVSTVCEVMRLVIAVQHRTLEQQKAFFDRYLYQGGVAFCDAVIASEKADFYRLVAAFAGEFFRLERTAFDMA